MLNFVPFDPEYMNFKIDFFNQVELTQRKDLGVCSETERANFEERAERSTGVLPTDFQFMRCIDED